MSMRRDRQVDRVDAKPLEHERDRMRRAAGVDQEATILRRDHQSRVALADIELKDAESRILTRRNRRPGRTQRPRNDAEDT